jgi:hypothetical protein
MILAANDSRREWTRTVLIVNALGALIAGGFAVAALVDPAAILPGVTASAGLRLYAAAYAARQLPLTAVLLGLLARPARRALVPVLVLAGLVQAGDVVIGVASQRVGMIVGGGLLAVVHLASARWLGRPAAQGRATMSAT